MEDSTAGLERFAGYQLPRHTLIGWHWRVLAQSRDARAAEEIEERGLAAEVAIGHIGPYLAWLPHLDDARKTLSREADAVGLVFNANDEICEDQVDPEQWDLFDHLLGKQEVAQHLFMTCAKKIVTLFDAANALARAKVSPEDRALIRDIVKVRDYFEHLENQLPNRTHEAQMTTRFELEGTARIRHVRNIGDDGSVMAPGGSLQINSATSRRVEDLCVRLLDSLTQKCVADIEAAALPSEVFGQLQQAALVGTRRCFRRAPA